MLRRKPYAAEEGAPTSPTTASSGTDTFRLDSLRLALVRKAKTSVLTVPALLLSADAATSVPKVHPPRHVWMYDRLFALRL